MTLTLLPSPSSSPSLSLSPSPSPSCRLCPVVSVLRPRPAVSVLLSPSYCLRPTASVLLSLSCCLCPAVSVLLSPSSCLRPTASILMHPSCSLHPDVSVLLYSSCRLHPAASVLVSPPWCLRPAVSILLSLTLTDASGPFGVLFSPMDGFPVIMCMSLEPEGSWLSKFMSGWARFQIGWASQKWLRQPPWLPKPKVAVSAADAADAFLLPCQRGSVCCTEPPEFTY